MSSRAQVAEEVKLLVRVPMDCWRRRGYRRRIEVGVAREQAREDLPLATYTEACWKVDLHNLLHFLEPTCPLPRARRMPRETCAFGVVENRRVTTKGGLCGER